jgi:hypothetical protein
MKDIELERLQAHVATFAAGAIGATFTLSRTTSPGEFELAMSSTVGYDDARYFTDDDFGDAAENTLRAWAMQMAICSATKAAFDTFTVAGTAVGDCRVAEVDGIAICDHANFSAYVLARATKLGIPAASAAEIAAVVRASC